MDVLKFAKLIFDFGQVITMYVCAIPLSELCTITGGPGGLGWMDERSFFRVFYHWPIDSVDALH